MSRRNRRALGVAILAAFVAGVAFVLLYAAISDAWFNAGNSILIVTVATWFVVAGVRPVWRLLR
ncbi:hypothetical protein [Asanoa siamensis]|uniref:Uncharacterized protein n=1 Tax=Asanoa siamensis TaxID=926357 RepID=A0ABQ4CKW7_9ACTN|nr:hypothetical protein [Asanoa siamensis]GIF71919.1 hypothetical protein Asi02nite_14370 [Asanoa siamensis]